MDRALQRVLPHVKGLVAFLPAAAGDVASQASPASEVSGVLNLPTLFLVDLTLRQASTSCSGKQVCG